MADFNRKKLQVFVSSTYRDLVKERQAAVEAILSAGHIPAGMELFTAGDESQMEVIKQWIDESDVYLLILGGRYGSVEPKTHRSYIHLEYEYALSQNKPLFACVIAEKAIEPRVKAEGMSVVEVEYPQELKAFRAEVLTKMSKFWEDTKDIKIAVTESLSHLARRENLVGWVRPNTQSNVPALADEIARLSKQNDQYRRRVVELEELLPERRLTRPKIPSLDYFRKLAEKYPRNAIQEAWDYAEKAVNYALVTHGLECNPKLAIGDRISRLIRHGEMTNEDGKRVINDFYRPYIYARSNPEFTLCLEDIMNKISAVLSFSAKLVEKCDGIWAIRNDSVRSEDPRPPEHGEL
jgi:polyhydroxyalkanoate synthesis regulator phasin